MTTQSIQPSVLKDIRKARKLGRPKLAKLSGLTERQLARLEGAATMRGDLPVAALSALAQVLQVPEAVLTGDLPVTADDLQPARKSTCSSGCCG